MDEPPTVGLLDTTRREYVALQSFVTCGAAIRVAQEAISPIRAVKIVNPEYTVERILERMREASAETSSTGAHGMSPPYAGTNGGAGYVSRLDITPISFQPDFQPQEEYDVNDLLKFSDEHFVENAYRALLKRSADPVGGSGLLASLRNGELNKIDVLARLRYSKEGRAEGVRVRGLLAPAALRALYRIPLAGYGLNLLVAFFRLPSIVRSHRQFEAHLLAHEEIVVRHLNHVGQSLVNEARALETAQQQLLEQVQVAQQQLLEHVKEENARLAAEQADTHEILLTRVAALSRYVEERINDEAAERSQNVGNLEQRVSSLAREIQSTSAQLEAEQQQHAERLVAEIDEARNLLTQLREEMSSAHTTIAARLDGFIKRERLSAAELSLQREKLRRLTEEPQSWQTRTLSAGQTETTANVDLLDNFFASFDEQFRGDRDAIKERLKPYLEFLNELNEARIVDLGCGRGEWLELLREQGFNAAGVDLNGVLVSACKERGLDVVEQDLFAYLLAVPDGSLGALTAFHLVEHLSIGDLVRFLNEAMRVLKHGGVLMLETPNPRNVLVGSCNFYFDPTHRNPLPSEVLQLWVETRGFDAIKVLPLNPSDAMPVPGDSEIVNRFNQYFYGPMDYGLIAYRP